jgi:acetyltransferase-like isoleucine patch superfamily enzyme
MRCAGRSKMGNHRYSFPSDINIGENYNIDERAIIGYAPMRESVNITTMIGRNLVAFAGAVIYKGIKLGDNVVVGHNAIIREENIIGNNFKLWNNSIIDYGCKIGNNVKIHCNCYIAQYTIIENDVFLAPGVVIGNDLHPGCDFSKICMQKTFVVVKKGAQVGLNVTILPGVSIGEKALIGAGSVVTKDVPPETVVIGNPAKVTKTIYDLRCDTELTDRPYHEQEK